MDEVSLIQSEYDQLDGENYEDEHDELRTTATISTNSCGNGDGLLQMKLHTSKNSAEYFQLDNSLKDNLNKSPAVLEANVTMFANDDCQMSGDKTTIIEVLPNKCNNNTCLLNANYKENKSSAQTSTKLITTQPKPPHTKDFAYEMLLEEELSELNPAFQPGYECNCWLVDLYHCRNSAKEKAIGITFLIILLCVVCVHFTNKILHG